MVRCTFLRVSRGNQEDVLLLLLLVIGSGVGYVKFLDTYKLKFNYGTNAAGQYRDIFCFSFIRGVDL